MHGVVTLLDPENTKRVEAIWTSLDSQCDLRGISVTPFPHFSYQIANDYDWDRVAGVLREICTNTKPFDVHTAGLALFTGESPVIYVPVVRSAELSRLHELVWNRLDPISIEASPYYAPQFWMPHISIAYSDVDRHALICAVKHLAFQPHNWIIPVNNLTLIYEPDGEVGTKKYQFPFGE
jgi:2'-5' RNA ligase